MLFSKSLKCLLKVTSCPFLCSVVSALSHEGSAHRPVEMLPVVRPRNKRKAAQLQVCDFCTEHVDTIK